MTKPFQVGDLVISHTKTRQPVAVIGKPALVIDTRRTGYPHWLQSLRLKVGEVEWWDAASYYEKMPDRACLL